MSLGANDALDPCLAPTKHPLAVSPSSAFTVLSQPSKGSDGGGGSLFSPPHHREENQTREKVLRPWQQRQAKQAPRSPAPLPMVGLIIFHTGDAQASPAQP